MNELPLPIWADMLEDEEIDTSLFRAAIDFCCADVSATTRTYSRFSFEHNRWVANGDPYWDENTGDGCLLAFKRGDAGMTPAGCGYVWYNPHEQEQGDGDGFAS